LKTQKENSRESYEDLKADLKQALEKVV